MKTRRMWARRLLRAGWLIAPILSLPSRAYRFFLCDDATGKFDFGAMFITLISLGLLSGITSCSVMVVRENMTATAAEVTAALKDDPCMVEMMPRWLKKQARPLSLNDLDEGKAACTKAFETHYAKIEQQKAMAIAGGKK